METHSEDSSYSTLTPRGDCPLSATPLPFVQLEASADHAPSERYGHSAVVVGQYMYVFGGCDVTGRFMDDLHRMELDSGCWELIGTAASAGPDGEWPQGRHFHRMVSLDEQSFLLLFGKSNGYMNDVWEYQVSSRLWRRAPVPADGAASLPSRRYGHSAVSWGGDVYVFGGFDDFGLRCNDIWRYERSCNRWTAVLHLQSEAPDVLHHCAATYQGSMLVWGGMDNRQQLYEFRFGSQSWSAVQVRSPPALCPRPKWGAACFMWEDSL